MPYPPFYNFPYQQMQYPITPQPSSQDGFIHVQSENQARSWDVMPGQSRTFINDNAPYCYTKSMPVSQLEPMVFKRFRLVEEPDSPQDAPQQPDINKGIDLSGYVQKAEFEPFCALIEDIKADIESIRRDLYDESAGK